MLSNIYIISLNYQLLHISGIFSTKNNVFTLSPPLGGKFNQNKDSIFIYSQCLSYLTYSK